MHHLVFDGVSLYRVILPELATLYGAFAAGRPSPLAEPIVQYADYAAWERTDAANVAYARSLEYWRQRLADVSSLPLPLDHPRPDHQRFHGGMEPLKIPKDLADRLDELSREAGSTFFQTMACAFAVLLSRYSGQEDIVFGTVIDLRARPEFEAMVGYCLTPLVVRADLSGDPTFLELLARMRETLLDGLEHKVPFQQLVSELHRSGEPGANPIFQSMVVLEPEVAAPDPDWSLHQMESGVGNAVGHAKVDLHIELDRRPDGHVSGRLIYNTDLFEPDTARRMVGHWGTLLEGIADRAALPISALPCLTEAERRQQLVDWNATDADLSTGSCIQDMITAQARRTPDKVGVMFADEVMTYAELDRHAERVARHLRAVGAGPGTIVALYLERSLEMVVGMIATLKAGAAYLPLDPRHPTDRLAFMLRDAGASVLLTQRGLLDTLPTHSAITLDVNRLMLAREPSDAAGALPATDPDGLAYVIYTSGSTGKPKGVAVCHSSVVNLISAMAHRPGLTSDDKFLAVAPYSFDMSVGDVWPTLGVGATLVLASPEEAADGRALGRLISTSGATVMQATPATWQMLLDAGWDGQAGLVVQCGGEELSSGLAESLLDRSSAVWNMYGPTETTVWSTCEQVQRDVGITIGRPVANTRIYILDKHLLPVPVGVAGELCIGGAGVARGYFHRPELTASRFLPDPFVPHERIYRTGDFARYLPDGRIEHLGRIDHQVKLRGFRIEPGEVEAALQAHPGVSQALVLVQKDGKGDASLVAYLVGRAGAPPPAGAALRALLKTTLPNYMVPSTFVPLEALPLSPNGKVDRQALPDLEYHSSQYVAPRNDLEVRLAGIFARVLAVQRVGAEDDFFDLGGHSLLAARLLRDVEAELGVKVPLASIFQESATIAGMAKVIESRRDPDHESGLVIPIQSRGTAPVLFFVQPDESAMLSLRHFTGPLGPNQRVLGLLPERVGRHFDQSRGIEQLAEPMLATIRKTQPHGPYLLAGYSLGGLIAYEIAGRLNGLGERVAWLGILDAAIGEALFQRELWPRSPRGFLGRLAQVGPWGAAQVAKKLAWRWMRAPLVRSQRLAPAADDFDYRGAVLLGARYACPGHEVPMDLFTSADRVNSTGSSTLGWEKVHLGQIRLHAIPGKHLAMLTEPNVRLAAEILSGGVRGALETTAVGPGGL
jgi:amino acid adenylation domain-containing protein